MTCPLPAPLAPVGLAGAASPCPLLGVARVRSVERMAVDAVSLPAIQRIPVPSLGQHVLRVVLRATEEEVRGIHASAVIARVADDQPVRDFSTYGDPCCSVGENLIGASGPCELAVAVSRDQSCPVPAFAGLVGERGKPFGEGLSVARDTGISFRHRGNIQHSAVAFLCYPPA